jgi:nucleoside 2-deoxyribosyltransferase
VNIKTPSDKQCFSKGQSVFLAGTTDSDLSGGWQSKVENELSNLDVTILNPKLNTWFRPDQQSVQNEAFKSQVDWELTGLENADIVVLCLLEASDSSTTLIEFGLTARTGKLIVYCEEYFWRFGNIEVTCHRYDIPMAKSLDELIVLTKEKLNIENE